jgi:glutathione synthase/RimK-type ligase-like ATP-grasp enzyme
LKRKSVGFLCLGECHTEYPAIVRALIEHGIESQLIDLCDCDSIQWDQFNLINVRECRGYHHHPNFLAKIDVLETQLGQVPLANSFPVIRAAIDKANYLRGLQLSGVDLIPTLWLKRQECVRLEEIFEKTGWDDFVIKPTISSKSWNTYRVLSKGNHIQIAKADTEMVFQTMTEHVAVSELMGPHDLCIQKFMPEIFSEGELSFVFINNQFSHAIRKTVGSDNWLAHEFFGGNNACYSPEKRQLSWARGIFSVLQQKYGDFLYARIDAIPDNQDLRLLECELIVPRLFLNEGNALNNYVQAIISRLL